MSFEIEQKYRTPSHDRVASALAALGARAGDPVEQEDVYLQHPGRDFARTGEAVRIRRDGPANAVTYKGPKHPGPAKTREEIEVAYAEGPANAEAMLRLFRALGFEPVATVAKRRTPYALRHEGRALNVVLDDAGPVGLFVEVETIAEGEQDFPGAQAAVLSLAEALGLTDVEPRSYLRMALEAGGGGGGGGGRISAVPT